jgi:HDOD domain
MSYFAGSVTPTLAGPTKFPAMHGKTDILNAATALHLVGAGSGPAARLIGSLCDETLGAQQLASRIESHPVLCARVLKVANSPYYGQAKSVNTVQRALLVLGVNAVRGIAAAACINQVMPRRTAAIHDLERIFNHGLATALAAEALAGSAHPSVAPDAFIAGLLHNLGIIIQASLDPAGTTALIAACSLNSTADIRLLESQHSSVRHEECAAVLFDAWGLPDPLVAAALHHHRPDEARPAHRTLVGLVGDGSLLALGCGFTHSLEPAQPYGLVESPLAANLTERVNQLINALALHRSSQKAPAASRSNSATQSARHLRLQSCEAQLPSIPLISIWRRSARVAPKWLNMSCQEPAGLI